MRFSRQLSALAALMVSAASAVHAQGPVSWTAGFFSVTNDNSINPDFQTGIDGGVVTGLVNNTLGPGGLPTVSAFGAARAVGSGNISQINGNGELQWWTPAPGSVAADGGGPIAFGNINVPSNFWVTGEGSNDNFFKTAWYSTTWNSGTALSFSGTLGADDDAWLFINGQLVLDNGGVKAISATSSVNNYMLNAGVNRIDLFFADRNTVQSGLVFTQEFTQIVPEPSSVALLMAGSLVFVAGYRRRTRIS